MDNSKKDFNYDPVPLNTKTIKQEYHDLGMNNNEAQKSLALVVKLQSTTLIGMASTVT